MFWLLAFGCWAAGAGIPVCVGWFLFGVLAAGLNGLVVRGGFVFVMSLGFFLFLLLAFVEGVEGVPPVKVRGVLGVALSVS